MLNVMIVDDEPKVREGLKTIINWNDYGYSICGECADGIEGLEMIDILKPDLVLADIRMPEMNGLEFIEKAKQKGVASKFIILTGYSDFAYMKKAIQLSVDSYLLKPVDEDELIQNIVEMREAIYKEKEIRKSINDARILSRESAIKALLKGETEIPAAEVKRISGSKLLQVALVQLTGRAIYSADAISKQANSQIFKASRNNSLIFEVDGRICIVLADSDVERNRQLMKEFTEYLHSNNKNTVLITLGRKVDGIADISSSYADAVRLIEKRFYFAGTGILDWYEIKDDIVLSERCEPSKDKLDIDIALSIERLYVAAEVTNFNRIRDLSSEICTVLRNKQYSEMKIKGFCSNLLNAVYTKAAEKYPVLAEILPREDERVTGIYDKSDIRQLNTYLTEQLEKLSNAISDVDPQSVIKRIIRYIDENYSQDLTLEMLGGLFGYNSCYLGKVIRQYTGEHFNTYLEKVRIEQAKELLLQGYKAGDAALKTGFKNIDYFYFKFKKNVGVSTSEFKKGKMS